MTPLQAAKAVRKLAESEKVSVTEYCIRRGVAAATITRWEKYRQKTAKIETMRKLGLDA